ncbi:MAG: DUF6364 family protein [Gemmatimonadaceae bacterium]
MMRRIKIEVDPDAIKHGEKYCRLHRTDLSQLVNDFLKSLPLETKKKSEYSPAVQRLIGAARPKKPGQRPPDVEDYHRYLMKKYGGEE